MISAESKLLLTFGPWISSCYSLSAPISKCIWKKKQIRIILTAINKTTGIVVLRLFYFMKNIPFYYLYIFFDFFWTMFQRILVFLSIKACKTFNPGCFLQSSWMKSRSNRLYILKYIIIFYVLICLSIQEMSKFIQ